MPEDTRRKKRLTTSIVFLIIAVCLLALFALTHKTPEPTQQVATFSGTDDLLSAGATNFVLSDMKFAFYQFLKQNNKAIGQNVKISGVTHIHDSTTGYDQYKFRAIVGDSSYAAVLRTTSLDSAQLVLSDTSGKVVFDSGVVTLTH